LLDGYAIATTKFVNRLLKEGEQSKEQSVNAIHKQLISYVHKLHFFF